MGFGFRVSGFWFRVAGFGIRDSDFGFRVSGFGSRDYVRRFFVVALAEFVEHVGERQRHEHHPPADVVPGRSF